MAPTSRVLRRRRESRADPGGVTATRRQVPETQQVRRLIVGREVRKLASLRQAAEHTRVTEAYRASSCRITSTKLSMSASVVSKAHIQRTSPAARSQS